MILESVKSISGLPVSGVKLQLLHVLKGTDLADYYQHTGFPVFSMEEYVELVIDCLEYLSQDIVIHRLTGDGPKDLLIAPLWSTKKRMRFKYHSPPSERTRYFSRTTGRKQIRLYK